MITITTAQELFANSLAGDNSTEIRYQDKIFRIGPVYSQANRQIALNFCHNFTQNGCQCLLSETDWGITVWIEQLQPVAVAIPTPEATANPVDPSPLRVYRGVAYTEPATTKAIAVPSLAEKRYRGVSYRKSNQVCSDAIKPQKPAQKVYRGVTYGSSSRKSPVKTNAIANSLLGRFNLFTSLLNEAFE